MYGTFMYINVFTFVLYLSNVHNFHNLCVTLTYYKCVIVARKKNYVMLNASLLHLYVCCNLNIICLVKL